MLALTHAGRLLRYRHRAWLEGGLVEIWLGPQKVASDIRNADLMFVLMPASTAAVPQWLVYGRSHYRHRHEPQRLQ